MTSVTTYHGIYASLDEGYAHVLNAANFSTVESDLDDVAGNSALFLGDRVAKMSDIEGLAGTGQNDVRIGDDGDNTLVGNSGDDILIGGKGTELLEGGAGGDTFWFDNNAGANTVEDFTVGPVTTEGTTGDRLFFFGATSLDDLTLTVSGGNTLITFGSTTVTLEGVETSKELLSVELAEESDGTIAGFSLEALDLNYIAGTSGNDTLVGTEEDDFLEAFDGGNRVDGEGGNDLLVGGSSTESFSGGTGNDTFEAGSGSNYFFGDFALLCRGSDRGWRRLLLLWHGHRLDHRRGRQRHHRLFRF